MWSVEIFAAFTFSSVFGGIEWAADRGSRASIAQRFGGIDAEHITRGLAMNPQFLKNDAAGMSFGPRANNFEPRELEVEGGLEVDLAIGGV
jgi:hypothetical protein